jgi:hypothetical protein
LPVYERKFFERDTCAIDSQFFRRTPKLRETIGQ